MPTPKTLEAADHPALPAMLSLTATAPVSIEAKAAEGDGPAPLPRFEMIANTGSVPMRLEGWRYPVVLDFAGLTIPSQNRPIRLGHDPNKGVGHTDRIAILDGKLVTAGVISRDTAESRDVVSSSKNGFPWQASVGASVEEVEFVKEGQTVEVNGQQFKGPLNVIRKGTLGEISFVDLGADGKTSAKVAAMAKEPTQYHDDPLDVAAADGAEATRQAIGRAKVERERQAAIQAMTEEALTERGADIAEIEAISDKALDEKWTIKDTQIALLRASRTRAPQMRRADMPTPKVLEASLCLSLGIKDETLAKDRDYGPDVMARAWPLRNRGLRGTIAAALEAMGVPVPHGSRELFTALLDSQRIQAGFSTINLPGILGNVANKLLLESFKSVNAIYDLVANQADFSNFHTHTIYRLDALGEFEQVPADGEIKHGYVGEDSYTNKLETYGKMLVITRQDIINDDLNAFRSLTTQLARKGRIAVDKALVNALMESSDSFYTSARGNKLTGSLGITELGAAEAALMQMAGADGEPIYGMPKYLVVPPALKFLADSIYTSAQVNETTTTNKMRPTDNPYRGRFEVISSPYLSASTLDGYSASTWYLLADPNMVPAFQVAYLDGRRAPTVETADAEFSTLGLQMRCYWDFGVAQLDYRGAIKNV